MIVPLARDRKRSLAEWGPVEGLRRILSDVKIIMTNLEYNGGYWISKGNFDNS